MEREELVKELRRIIRSRNNDGVKLAWLGEDAPEVIGKLDLRAVTEVKRSEKGAFEVKFINRLEALELLDRLTCREDGDGLEDFLDSLREEDGP